MLTAVALLFFLAVSCGKKTEGYSNNLCTDPFLHDYTSAKAEVGAFKVSVEKKAETNFDNLKRLETAKALQNKLQALSDNARANTTYCQVPGNSFVATHSSHYLDLKFWVDNYVRNWK